MRWLFIAITVFALVALSPGNALACSCLERVPCQAYGEASAVFVGTVIDSRIITIKQANYERKRRAVRLSVDSPFRGVRGSKVEVTTAMGGGDCGFGFVPSQQYLVYASEYEGKLSTSICSRTRSIARAAEDLSYIRGLATAKPGATISGKVVKNRRNKDGGYDNLPLAGTKVTIEGQAKRKIRTDMKGQFRVEGLPAGTYVVKISVPDGLAVTGVPEQKVEVTDRGCAVVEFWLEPARKLSGSLSFARADRRLVIRGR
ncbi:MAG: carboxypeptidase regulatory-like domain-containing protein [Pyrinomonadaceae bacterium]|nr:carboxypeptidase regulatory-like domain-containing protein [Pyrinomonadaceae bacterium]